MDIGRDPTTRRAMTKFTRQNPPTGFYTYAYLREDGRPYYIGKGKGRRAWRQHGSAGRYWKPPGDERILLLKWGLTEEEAFAHEVYLIAVYGNAHQKDGWLSMNFDEGGLGATGARHTEEHKEHMRQVMTGRVKITEQGRKSLAEARRSAPKSFKKEMGIRSAAARKRNGYTPSNETRQKMSDSMKGQNKYERTPGMRVAISVALTGHKQSEEQVEKRRAKLIGKVRTPAMRQRYAESAKKREQCPKVIAKREAARQKRYQESAEKYGVTLAQWISFPQKVRVMLSARYGRGKRGAELLAGIAAA